MRIVLSILMLLFENLSKVESIVTTISMIDTKACRFCNTYYLPLKSDSKDTSICLNCRDKDANQIKLLMEHRK